MQSNPIKILYISDYITPLLKTLQSFLISCKVKSKVLTMASNALLEMITSLTSPPYSYPSFTLVQLHFYPWNILLLPQDLCTGCLPGMSCLPLHTCKALSLTFLEYLLKCHLFSEAPLTTLSNCKQFFPDSQYFLSSLPYFIFSHNSCHQHLTY